MQRESVNGGYAGFVVTQEKEGGDQGQEGAHRQGGGISGRPLHHFKSPDGAT